MNVKYLSALRSRRFPTGHSRGLSRREFVSATGGAMAALGSGLLRPRLLSAAAPDDPLPIPGSASAPISVLQCRFSDHVDLPMDTIRAGA